MVPDHVRKYGTPPYTVAVLHGGPGAPGEVAPVARELSSRYGVLEPLQTADSVQGHVNELREVVKSEATLPVILTGYSWGAFLAFLFAAQNPQMVKKVILVGSAVFSEDYAAQIMATRKERLSLDEREKLERAAKNASFDEVKKILEKTDLYDPLPHETEILAFQRDLFQKVWSEGQKMRREGSLLEAGKKIIAPVVAIHGDYDPHPKEGIEEPLSRVIRNFRFILLEKCGHTPWLERFACKKFYEILFEELS